MKTVVTIVKIAAIVYLIVCVVLFFIQEKLVFFPQKLPGNYQFQFNQNFKELHFTTTDNKRLNGVLFKADSSKGLIFYLHGNAGCLQSWGQIAKTYTDLHYDLFMLDYRGYGKSEGSISSEQQFYEDVQLVYDSMKKIYTENGIVVLGYSIGTGAATKIAAANDPRLLILQAPYYSLTDLIQNKFKIIPGFLVKYKFETNKNIRSCKMPVAIFHGDKDEIIYYGSSLKLQAQFKPADTLITLINQGHNGMSDNFQYRTALQKILSR